MKYALIATTPVLPAFLLASCNPKVEPPVAKADPYGVSKMDLKPTPATPQEDKPAELKTASRP